MIHLVRLSRTFLSIINSIGWVRGEIEKNEVYFNDEPNESNIIITFLCL
jgi:hypothetical protein